MSMFLEDLTELRQKILMAAKNVPKVKKSFTVNGRIICYLDDDKKVIIDGPNDLAKLGVPVDWKSLGLDHYNVDFNPQ